MTDWTLADLNGSINPLPMNEAFETEHAITLARDQSNTDFYRLTASNI